MKQLLMNEALGLSRASTSPSISIYLDIDKNKNTKSHALQRNLDRLLRNVEGLVERSFDRLTTGSLVPSLKTALRRLQIPNDAGGLAIYHKNGFTGYLKIPSQVSSLAIAAKSFHLKPVLRCSQLHQAYFMTVFRKNASELWLVHPEQTQRLLLVKWDHKPRVNEGYPSLLATTKMNRFCHKMNQIYQKNQLPILLAGSQIHQEIFRQHSTKCGFEILEKTLTGSIDHLEIKSLINLANPILSNHFAALDDRKVLEFHKAESAGLTSTNIHEIAQWVIRGQVDMLLVAEDRHIWGELNRGTGEIQFVQRSNGLSTDDLLDDLAEITYSQGSRVLVLPTWQMPKGFAIAAVAKSPVPQLHQSKVLPLSGYRRLTADVRMEPLLDRRAEL